ncbi:HAD family hydrolase [Clostridium uliginosum]|uniref:Haloacid dehalogenase superfamily, subfamily IA, variant 3 with third motif having DD or ED/haloacid dehalogenase superfamily, subfamily IA, variant 1 with third motif having Dx(3-4)D or Dx(3-4)E n=1 Tax=Clostridium uliginosum TaxID=119641 RepID=A0A1I1GYY1_9CLOT|nr:HAD family hydrolase [Clostridium uliginosum]SFC16706.1 haloacid dehalogenase superfamily, subfamily IA, variant 3 with third motif having DD or ED/haloacid dehalogenase superfamily, subfamily IA, variant 1 with third motif having Dx(3-4)D or Dx(3-4)E [Clostridium uliginosum]
MKAVIFDMDGVIIDSEPMHFDIDLKTMQHFGCNIIRSNLEKYAGMTNPDICKQLKKEYNIKESIDEIIAYQMDKKIKFINEENIEPIDGIRELLLELNNNRIPIAIGSSSPRGFVETVLLKFGIIDYFNVIVTGDEVEQGKPAPDIYIEVAKKLKLDVKECIVVEDSRNGVIAAKNAGMSCIGFNNINSGNQDLSKADITVNSIREINITNLSISY